MFVDVDGTIMTLSEPDCNGERFLLSGVDFLGKPTALGPKVCHGCAISTLYINSPVNGWSCIECGSGLGYNIENEKKYGPQKEAK